MGAGRKVTPRLLGYGISQVRRSRSLSGLQEVVSANGMQEAHGLWCAPERRPFQGNNMHTVHNRLFVQAREGIRSGDGNGTCSTSIGPQRSGPFTVSEQALHYRKHHVGTHTSPSVSHAIAMDHRPSRRCAPRRASSRSRMGSPCTRRRAPTRRSWSWDCGG